MTETLQQFNAFGFVKATANEVSVSLTAITEDGKPISRVLLQEFEEPLDIFEPGEFVTATFAAMIEESGSRIAYNDMIISETRVADVPGVAGAVGKTINMVKKALQ
jgi:hypothetical protein